MHARVWGCRGSLATPGEATRHYGGNTTSVEVRTEQGTVVVLDAGTGIRHLGLSLDRPKRVHLLLTHMHLDHVEGLGFFAPLFDPDCAITIWAPAQEGRPLAEHIAAYLSPPFFPVQFAQFGSRIEFVEVWDDDWQIDDLRVTCAPVQHPGRTVGYRLQEGDRTLAFIPDNELALDPEPGMRLAAGADVVLHDAQYTADEYATRAGWGHSDVDHFGAFAREVGAKRVLMFHHDPAHSDTELDAMRAAAEQLAGRELELAAEGLDVSPGLAEPARS
jgi:phosphoribosyl 1,2-cyclic phosphodiesterase